MNIQELTSDSVIIPENLSQHDITLKKIKTYKIKYSL